MNMNAPSVMLTLKDLFLTRVKMLAARSAVLEMFLKKCRFSASKAAGIKVLQAVAWERLLPDAVVVQQHHVHLANRVV